MTTQSNTQTFNSLFDEMKQHGMKLPVDRVGIAVPQAEAVMKHALSYFLSLEGRRLEWLPEYAKVCQWLEGNEGRGLFLYGNCGRGKSLLCRYVLPAILLRYCRKVVSVYDMQELNHDIDTALRKHLLSLDDVGTEEVSVKYGERRLAFAEVMDAAEKSGKLVIVSTNLNEAELRERYGDRVLDRIRSTTVRIKFVGQSLRR